MKKSYVWVIILVVVVAGGLIGYAVFHKNKDYSNSTNNMNMNMNSSHSSSSNQSATATNSVAIQNYAFSPSSITVKVGAQVTWTNKDSVAHTVTESDGQTGPNSGNVDPGARFSHTFKTPGTYHYRCTIHPEMVGTVTVTS